MKLLACLVFPVLILHVTCEKDFALDLTADDECGDSGGGACGLSALQLHSHQVDRERADRCVDDAEAFEEHAAALSHGKSCEDRFPNEAKVIRKYFHNTSNRVLLFGWMQCPCVEIAQARFAAAKLCYVGRQWENPKSTLMKYLQCKEGDDSSHSFIYFRSGGHHGNGWTYAGNGFKLDKKAMSESDLEAKIQNAEAKTDCNTPNVKVNVYGTQLEECRVGNDIAGSWEDDGTCSEQTGGVHQICIEKLPADFSQATHQSPWSRQRAGKRHCVCVGAWSLYMTDAQKHADGAKEIMPHCKSIPETVFTTRYLSKWRDWNGYPASVLSGLKELVSRCIEQESSTELKCGLKERFKALQHSQEAKELKNADELAGLNALLAKVHCLRHG